MNRSALRATTALAILVLSSVLGCARSHDRVAAPVVPATAPVADSPEHTMRLLEWCWNHRDATAYSDLLSPNYLFTPPAIDSSAGALVTPMLTRSLELDAALNLFERGLPGYPAANSISLAFDPNLVALPDSRPGMNDEDHREISTSFVLAINTDQFAIRSAGRVRAFLVRGQGGSNASFVRAGSPGIAADRWSIERVDEYYDSGLSLTSRKSAIEQILPSRNWTWAMTKTLYLSPGPRPAL